jgi:X-Pro dipeptidyl-peptidase
MKRLRSRTRWNRVGLVAAAALTLVASTGCVSTPTSHQASPPSAGPRSYQLDGDGTTGAVYSYPQATRETVWVDIGMDQDGDGVNDRVAADIIRPSEPATRHLRIPAIIDASGYYYNQGRGNEHQTKKLDASGKPTLFPLFLDNYFVPRGYAVILVDLAGTGRSTGCADFMGPSERASSTRVIDWLNGHAPGYTSPKGDTRQLGTWSDGIAGMIGKSWDGTTAYEAAVSGVQGLRAAVAESGVTSAYTALQGDTGTDVQLPTTADYLVANRVQNDAARANPHCQSLLKTIRADEPANGNYTRAWAARNLTTEAGRVTAAMLMIQGQIDSTVTPRNVGAFWSALPASTPKKLWLSMAGHVDPFDFRRIAWVDTVHRWFDRYLYGIDNHIADQPAVSVERTPGHWADQTRFPALPATPATLYAASGYKLSPRANTDHTVHLDAAQEASFRSEQAPAENHLSGTASATVTVTALTGADATISVRLEDDGPAVVRGQPGDDGIVTSTTERDCFGGHTKIDTGCFLQTTPTTQHVEASVLGSGVRDLSHTDSIERTDVVRPGQTYTLTVPLWTVDHIVPAGHRFKLIITSSQPVKLHLTGTSVTLPSVGGHPFAVK